MMQLSFYSLYQLHLKLKLLVHVPVKGDVFILICASIKTIVAFNHTHDNIICSFLL